MSMSIRTRLLTTLTSANPTSSTLIPPYSHSQAIPQEPSPSLRPPYAHRSQSQSQSHERGGERKVQPKMKYTLLDRSSGRKENEEKYLSWVDGLIKDKGDIEKYWIETLDALRDVERSGTRVPEISFHQLSTQLSDKSVLEDLKKIGIVLVRDVISDADAQAAGEDLRSYVQARSGHATYWHPYLLALRAHPSVLSANSQVMSALTGKEAKYIKADTISGLAQNRSQMIKLDKPWTSDQTISAHIALSPSQAGTYRVTPSIHAAHYAVLRSFFKPKQSRISFYNKEGYLHPSNWTSTNPSYSSEPITDLPHLTDSIDLPEIRAGDIVYSHSALPLVAPGSIGGSGSDFLPISPLGAPSSGYVKEQRITYEQGLPPPHVVLDGSVALEQEGNKNSLLSNGGRAAMGY